MHPVLLFTFSIKLSGVNFEVKKKNCDGSGNFHVTHKLKELSLLCESSLTSSCVSCSFSEEIVFSLLPQAVIFLRENGFHFNYSSCRFTELLTVW